VAALLKFGLFSMNMDACSYPDGAARIARLAEAAGFDSLWAGEHVVLPDPRVPPSPMAPEDRILDPIVALSFLAAQTSQILLATGIIILPQRNPLVLAKELASLDVLSQGRLLVGIGAGYLEPEFQALGVPFHDRGARTDEYLAAMRAVWSEERPAYHGERVAFAGIQAHPQPVRRPHPPIVIGGHSGPAHRRAVSQGHGWYGFNLDLAATAGQLAGLRQAAAQVPRPASLATLEISVTPPSGPLDLETAKRYAALGVDRLILMPPDHLTLPALERFVHEAGVTLIGNV
jgi:probable F420-dependent oxidoreductase